MFRNKTIALVLSIALMISVMPSTSVFATGTTSDNSKYTAESYLNDYDAYLQKYAEKCYEGVNIDYDVAALAKDKTLIKNDSINFDGALKSADFLINVPEDGLYRIKLNYNPIITDEDAIELSVKINNNIPYSICESIYLARRWKDSGKTYIDHIGNESSPSSVQTDTTCEQLLEDPDGLNQNGLKFYLNKGENTLSLTIISGKLRLNKISLINCNDAPEYKGYSNAYSKAKYYDGNDIVIEAQDTFLKSSKELRSLSDRSDPMNTPSDAVVARLNYIGGENWDSAGEWISWKVDVPQSAYYKITFRYRQTYLENAASVRSLYIDDEILFSQMSEISFPYSTKWSYKILGDNKPNYVYLEKGEHTVKLDVSLGKIAQISKQLENVVFQIGELYRQIIMITGTEPDNNRDYRLFDQMPQLDTSLKKYSNELRRLANEYEKLAGSKGGSQAVNLTNLADTIDRMLKSKYKAHRYVGDLFNNYSSCGAWIFEMRSMPLDIEKIVLSSPESDIAKTYSAGFGKKLIHEIKRLVASYTVDYNTVSTMNENNSIDLWINLGRDQAQVLTNMISDDFTLKTGISVNVKIVSATMIQAMLSGHAPDVSIAFERTLPVNLAMRGALYDLTKFDDYDEVVNERYYGTMIEPYKFKNGVYALPDTQTFNVMFVRDDVFEEFGLSVPETWDDFMKCAAVLMRNNLSVGLPVMYSTFLYQYGGTLYNEDLTATNLSSTQATDAFEYMTSLFADYKLPVSFSFYNRFRTGEMPIGVSLYTDYSTLMAAAPEIRGKWSVHKIPGIRGENGEVNHSVVGNGTACGILNTTEKAEASWEFLKWWTAADAQERYNSEVESILGIAARTPTANLEALKRMSWGRGNSTVIVEQFLNTVNPPEIPGGYYLVRALDNAFYGVYNDHKNPKDMLLKWAGMVDDEISRKYEEISLIKYKYVS